MKVGDKVQLAILKNNKIERWGTLGEVGYVVKIGDDGLVKLRIYPEAIGVQKWETTAYLAEVVKRRGFRLHSRNDDEGSISIIAAPEHLRVIPSDRPEKPKKRSEVKPKNRFEVGKKVVLDGGGPALVGIVADNFEGLVKVTKLSEHPDITVGFPPDYCIRDHPCVQKANVKSIAYTSRTFSLDEIDFVWCKPEDLRDLHPDHWFSGIKANMRLGAWVTLSDGTRGVITELQEDVTTIRLDSPNKYEGLSPADLRKLLESEQRALHQYGCAVHTIVVPNEQVVTPVPVDLQFNVHVAHPKTAKEAAQEFFEELAKYEMAGPVIRQVVAEYEKARLPSSVETKDYEDTSGIVSAQVKAIRENYESNAVKAQEPTRSDTPCPDCDGKGVAAYSPHWLREPCRTCGE